jgi:hypothetical protein
MFLVKWLRSVVFVSSVFLAPTISAEIVFQESFDDLKDWTSDSIYKGPGNFDYFSVPENWYAGSSAPLWSPATGFPNHHPVSEILGSNSDKSRGFSGKSFVNWRESFDPGWKKFNSDSVLLKYFPQGFDELYVEFWITFSNEMVTTYYENDLGQSKLFRVYYFNGDESEVFDYFGDENKPSFNWDISGSYSSGFGVRNFQAYLARGDNYIADQIDGLPQNLMGSGDVSLWYSQSATKGQAVDGGTTQLEDLKNGGVIKDGPVHIDQVFGNEQQWVKVAFYVKMNSAPEVADGELMQWINDKRILHAKSIPWIRAGFDMVKWNTVGFGGNDFFQAYPNDAKHEEWYAIDDIVVRSDIPSYLIENPNKSPNSPRNLSVQ